MPHSPKRSAEHSSHIGGSPPPSFLARARQDRDEAKYRTAWFGISSEAYRLAGQLDKALATAREGLPLVEQAVLSHWQGMTPPLATLREKRRAG